jgi:DNA-binding transcriptional MerR regulator
MLTRDEILQILKEKHQIEITVRTFDYYRDEKIIPPIQARRQRQGLYPDNTPELIATIKKYQDQGMLLSDAKQLVYALEEKRQAEQEKIELQRKKKFRDEWRDPKARLNRLVSFLELKDEGQKYDVGMMGAIGETPETYLAAFYEKHIDFYRIQVDYHLTDNWKILDKKRFTPDGYEWILRSLLRTSIKEGRVLDKDDIFVSIFFLIP